MRGVSGVIAGALRCRGLVYFFYCECGAGMSANLFIWHCTALIRYERRKHEKGHPKKRGLPRRDRRLYRAQISIRSVREHKKGTLNSLLRARSLRWTTTTPKFRCRTRPTTLSITCRHRDARTQRLFESCGHQRERVSGERPYQFRHNR